MWGGRSRGERSEARAGRPGLPLGRRGLRRYSDREFLGTNAGKMNSTGTYNLFLAATAGQANTTGNYNVSIGEMMNWQYVVLQAIL